MLGGGSPPPGDFLMEQPLAIKRVLKCLKNLQDFNRIKIFKQVRIQRLNRIPRQITKSKNVITFDNHIIEIEKEKHTKMLSLFIIE